MNGNVLAAFYVLLIAAAPSLEQNEAGQSAETTAAAEASANDKQRARRLNQMMAAAADYELWSGGDDEHTLNRVERPVLRWSNPLRSTDDGAVFVWTDGGRPAAAMCIFSHGADGVTYGVDGVNHEWQSLATGPLRASYRKRPVWRPQVAGVEYRRIPGDAEPPASTPARRLSQMRRLVAEFTATVGREQRRRELRILPQPIYRFSGQKSEIVDGAVFVFTQATDPEVLLLLEARSEKDQPASWWWAAARMSAWHLEVKHREELVWTVDWNQRGDDRQPYITLSHPRTDLPDPE